MTPGLKLVQDLQSKGHEMDFRDWDMGSDGHTWNPDLAPVVLDWLWSREP
jgi:enterochelin esterase-like enzyme